MKEKIEEILNDENIVEIKDRVDAIAKVIPLYTVPKDKYNNLSERLQNVEGEKTTLENQYRELQKEHLTAEELQEAKLQELAEREAKIARIESETAISNILAQNGITAEVYGEDEYKSMINDLVGENQESSIKRANNFVGILAKQKETVENETTTKLLNDTPKPNTGTGDDEKVTKEDLEKMTYSEEMAFANENPELYAELSK